MRLVVNGREVRNPVVKAVVGSIATALVMALLLLVLLPLLGIAVGVALAAAGIIAGSLAAGRLLLRSRGAGDRGLDVQEADVIESRVTKRIGPASDEEEKRNS